MPNAFVRKTDMVHRHFCTKSPPPRERDALHQDKW